MPEEYSDGSGRFNIYAVGQDDTRKLIASSLKDEDADFISGVHGCFADLCRRLHVALDEADNLDEERDQLVCRVADLEMQVDSLNYQLGDR